MTKYDFYWKFSERPKRQIKYFLERLIYGEYNNTLLIQKFVNKHRGEVMLDIGFELCRLIGWTTQYEEDYYYIVLSPIKRRKNPIRLISCVGRLLPLKGKLSKFEYYKLENLWDLNDLTITQGQFFANKQGLEIR